MQYIQTRTSINLPRQMLEQAKIIAREQNISISQLIQQSLGQMLKSLETARIKQMYKGLFALKGMGKTHITDASLTIDEELYGENGAWKGMK